MENDDFNMNERLKVVSDDTDNDDDGEYLPIEYTTTLKRLTNFFEMDMCETSSFILCLVWRTVFVCHPVFCHQ